MTSRFYNFRRSTVMEELSLRRRSQFGSSRCGINLRSLRAKCWRSDLYAPIISNYREETDMGIIHRIDRRTEPRTKVDFEVTVWGVDTRGERFLQQAHVRDISLSGALLSGIDTDLRCGDVIGILYLGRKARYRVIWIRYDDLGDKIQAAIHRVAPDQCPWIELLGSDEVASQQPQEAEVPRN